MTATNGSTKTVHFSLISNPSPTYMCCGYPTDGHGIWSAINPDIFSPSSVVVDFAADGGADIGPADGVPNPCAKCAATEICVQLFDGMCGLGTLQCKAVSDSCRSKVLASGVTNCISFPECESEICLSPYRCTYNAACGTESPLADTYCYGP